jgi:uncharacterized protein (TIGR03118 family)
MNKLSVSLLGLGLLSGASAAYASDVIAFSETVLATSATDPDLINPWGISSSAASPFWVSDNGSGKTTLYNSAGVKQGLVVTMPAGSEDLTGQVFNGTASFKGDTFVFATENGTITGWRGALGTTAETLFTVAGAEYKGLAISNDKSTLYAANFAAGTIDVFNSTGKIASIADTTIPSGVGGFAPFNIQNINGQLYVTYAKVGPTGDDVAGAGNGFVSVFNPTSGTFTRIVSNGALNSPWGIAIAPNTFGTVGGDLLVGNFGDGLINAYDPITGGLVGTLATFGGTPIVNDGLWALDFGNGGSGGLANSLYITAGPDDESGGVFARIDAVPEPSALLLGAVGLAVVMLHRRRTASR